MGIGYKKEDIEYDEVFSKKMQSLSKLHWTPIEVIKCAVEWLGEKEDVHILDVGAGVGKFCLYGSGICSAKFTGVEIRKNLVDIANELKDRKNLKNVEFIASDIIHIDFKNYTDFYYFNPFGEQTSYAWIDDDLDFNEDNKQAYETYVYNQLNKMPNGTRIVTFCAPSFILPIKYKLIKALLEGELLFWEK